MNRIWYKNIFYGKGKSTRCSGRYIGIYCIDNGVGWNVGVDREKWTEYCTSNEVDEHADDQEFAQLVYAIHSGNGKWRKWMSIPPGCRLSTILTFSCVAWQLVWYHPARSIGTVWPRGCSPRNMHTCRCLNDDKRVQSTVYWHTGEEGRGEQMHRWQG